jgi:hypothetical protein
MNRKNTMIGLGAGVISILALTSHASADPGHFNYPRYNRPAHQEIRADRRELFKDRAALHSDRRELHKDKAELRHDLRRGAGAGEIAHDRREIRQDRHGIWGDRKEIRQDHGELRRDGRGYGWNRNFNRDNGRYSYAGNRDNWWNRGR